jgi:ABC-type transporter Mla MlaB component
MLKITLHDSAEELRLKLEGKLAGLWVGELQQCWRTAASTTQGRNTIADLRDVDFVDPEGQSLLAEMYRQGVRLVAVTPLIQALVQEISGQPGCVTVEEKPARRSHAFASPDTAGRDPRSL